MKFDTRSPVAIVIPVHNSLPMLQRTLVLLNGLESTSAHVIIVDDGSTDGTAAFLRGRTDLTTLTGSGSLWWTGAVDIGSRYAISAGAEAVVLWNDDNIASSTLCIDHLVKHVHKSGGCASPVVLQESPDGSRTVAAAGGDVDWTAGGVRLSSVGQSYEPSNTVVHCPWLPGNALAFSATLFEQLGGFDARRFPQYRGDADFTLRATAAGASCATIYSCWIVNDRARTGMNFQERVSPSAFINGLRSRKSNYHVPSTLRFYLRHCPKRYLPVTVPIFYAKYVYASLKTWRPGSKRASAATANEKSSLRGNAGTRTP